MTTHQSTTSSTDQLELVEVKPGTRFSVATLKSLLPDVQTLLFFGKVYDLNAQQLGNLLHKVLRTDLTSALFAEGSEHSADLQDYVVDICSQVSMDAGDVNLNPDVPTGEILPEVWKDLEVTVASSIKEVALKLEGVVARMPGKKGEMVFGSMMKMNAKRPIIGDYRASIVHARQKENLLILDVSGSMSEGTIRRIIEDVVALSYEANAHMAIVSNTTTHWEPGSYSVDDVLARCEYGGTHYETLEDLLNRDWGTVNTVADYDSSLSAKDHLRSSCHGSIDLLMDVSLQNRPTFLAECVGQFAADVRPLLIGSSYEVLT
jgi:hypothetical protein